MSGFDPQNRNNWYEGDWGSSNMRPPELFTEEMQGTQGAQSSSNCPQYQFSFGGFQPGNVMQTLFGPNMSQNIYGGTNFVVNTFGSSSGYGNTHENLYGASNMQSLHETGTRHFGVSASGRGDYSNVGFVGGTSGGNVAENTHVDERQEASEDNESEDSQEEDREDEGQVDEMDEEEMIKYADFQKYFKLYLDITRREGNLVPRKGKGKAKEKRQNPQWERLEDEYSIPQLNQGMWNLPRPSYDLPPRHVDEYIDPTVDRALAIGSVFYSKSRMQEKLVEYLMNVKAGFKTHKSERRRYWVRCRDEDCQFKMRARGSDSLWGVYKFIEHTCVLDPTRAAPSTLPSKHLGKIMAQQIVVEGELMAPKAVRAQLKQKGVDVTYGLARKIRGHAISSLYGDEDSSFKMLPSFLYMLEQTNPGTVTDYMVDPTTGQFRFAFFALGASIAGFDQTRPFIVIDGTHLKSKYKGILFVAVTKDGNNQIFPLAFGVGGVESRESWRWFLLQLRRAFEIPKEILIMSDGSQAISSAVVDALPSAHHVLCCQHIRQNLARYGKSVVNAFTAAAYSYKESDYNRHMDALKNMCPTAYEHLKNVVGEARFARVHCPVRRYDIMTSNVVESMNSRLLWARRLPICSLFEVIRATVGDWFTERYNRAQERTADLTEWAQEELLAAVNEGDSMIVRRTNKEGEYNVFHMQKPYLVIPSQRACSCKKYQHRLIPCAHAAAVIKFLRHDPTAYVLGFYTLKILKLTWRNRVVPIPYPGEWSIPEKIVKAICLPPDNPRQAGRPRLRRFPSGPEGGTRPTRTHKCRRCGGTGHNSKRCIVEIPQTVNEQNAPTERPPRARKKCRRCGVEGHTAPKCPIRFFDMNSPAN